MLINRPSVIVLVPVLNNASTISDCLSFLALQDYKNMKVYLLDGFSRNGTWEILKDYEKRYPNIFKAVQMKANVSSAYNYILETTKSDILAFIDADAYPKQDWLSSLISSLSHPNVAGVGGIVYTANPENPLSKAIGIELFDRFLKMPEFCTRFPTVNFAVKRNVFNFKFDDTLETDFDTEFCYNLLKHGMKLRYVKSAIVYHHHRDKISKYFKQQFWYGVNAVKVYFKYFRLLRGDTKTPGHMFLQPILWSLIGLLFLVSPIHFSFVIIGLLLTIGLLLFFLKSSFSLSRTYNSSMKYLFLILLVRSIAWTFGGIYGALRLSFRLLKRRLS